MTGDVFRLEFPGRADVEHAGGGAFRQQSGGVGVDEGRE